MELNEIMHILFFPGIIIHESAHALACLLLDVPIKKIKFLGKSGGYVVHEDSRTDKIIIIALFPFILLLMVWIGISSLLFSIPSDKDAENAYIAIKKTYTIKQSWGLFLLKILLSPLVLAILVLLGIFKVFDKFMAIR